MAPCIRLRPARGDRPPTVWAFTVVQFYMVYISKFLHGLWARLNGILRTFSAQTLTPCDTARTTLQRRQVAGRQSDCNLRRRPHWIMVVGGEGNERLRGATTIKMNNRSAFNLNVFFDNWAKNTNKLDTRQTRIDTPYDGFTCRLFFK